MHSWLPFLWLSRTFIISGMKCTHASNRWLSLSETTFLQLCLPRFCVSLISPRLFLLVMQGFLNMAKARKSLGRNSVSVLDTRGTYSAEVKINMSVSWNSFCGLILTTSHMMYSYSSLPNHTRVIRSLSFSPVHQLEKRMKILKVVQYSPEIAFLERWIILTEKLVSVNVEKPLANSTMWRNFDNQVVTSPCTAIHWASSLGWCHPDRKSVV